jgi:hypothetical protein
VSRSKKVKPDDKEQSKLFIEKAREIGADEEHSAADKLMERLAKTPKSRKACWQAIDPYTNKPETMIFNY